MIRRCDLCEFWVSGEQWGGGQPDDRHPDDYEGSCHRNAPRPTLGDFEDELMKHLTHLSWKAVEDEDKEKEFSGWEEAYLSQCSWPVTTGSSWCGEFRLRKVEAA